MKRLTTEEFINKAKQVHGDKYIYSKTTYLNNKTKIIIICPIHGEFKCTPHNHLRGHHCPLCSGHSNLVQGIGINDIGCNSKTVLYKKWSRMLARCYDSKYHEKYPTYIKCEVCDEWKKLSRFKEWFDKNYIDGYELDKDILIKGNKLYSPDTCCFVPREINGFLTKSDNARGKFPIGVCFYKPTNKYKADICFKGVRKSLGCFTTKEEAFNAYKNKKEKYIRELATEYFSKGLISDKVYNVLLSYEVKIDD